jgi:hypothetical protein
MRKIGKSREAKKHAGKQVSREAEKHRSRKAKKQRNKET